MNRTTNRVRGTDWDGARFDMSYCLDGWQIEPRPLVKDVTRGGRTVWALGAYVIPAAGAVALWFGHERFFLLRGQRYAYLSDALAALPLP